MPYPLKTGLGLGLGLRNSGQAMGSSTSRYFRRNLGDSDYYTHAPVTVDRIVMDVDPVSGSGGLPTGAPAVVDNVLQTIDFAYIGTIDELCRNGAVYFSGVMANVKYYLNGEQIHGYDMRSGNSNIPDTIGTNNATVIGGLAADWQIFTKQNTGEWLGQDISTVYSIETADIGGPSFSFYDISVLVVGRNYRESAKVSSYIGSGGVGFRSSRGESGGTGVRTIEGDGELAIEFLATSSGNSEMFNTTSNQCEFIEITVKEVINVA